MRIPNITFEALEERVKGANLITGLAYSQVTRAQHNGRTTEEVQLAQSLYEEALENQAFITSLQALLLAIPENSDGN